jgi:hypothetical protein
MKYLYFNKNAYFQCIFISIVYISFQWSGGLILRPTCMNSLIRWVFKAKGPRNKNVYSICNVIKKNQLGYELIKYIHY